MSANTNANRFDFEEHFKQTDWYKIEYKQKQTYPFAWNNEFKRYVWHDVDCAYKMWLAAFNDVGALIGAGATISEAADYIISQTPHQ